MVWDTMDGPDSQSKQRVANLESSTFGKKIVDKLLPEDLKNFKSVGSRRGS